MVACPLKFWNQFTAYSSCSNELKLGRMILNIGLHNCLEPNFSVSTKGRCGSCTLNYCNRFTALGIRPLELKLEFLDFSGGVVEACRFNYPYQSTDLGLDWLSWNVMESYWTSVHALAWSQVFRFRPKERAPLEILKLVNGFKDFTAWAETWEIDTWHLSAQLQGVRSVSPQGFSADTPLQIFNCPD